jgi:hypothetical protein
MDLVAGPDRHWHEHRYERNADRHLSDAETALHIARQAGVGSWISAAYDPLHEAVADHMVAVDARSCNRPVPSAHRAPRSPAAA